MARTDTLRQAADTLRSGQSSRQDEATAMLLTSIANEIDRKNAYTSATGVPMIVSIRAESLASLVLNEVT